MYHIGGRESSGANARPSECADWTLLAGPLEGKLFLIVIGAIMKWIEVFPMATATAVTTIQQLRQLIAQFGILESIVFDNNLEPRVSGILPIEWNLSYLSCTLSNQPSSNGLHKSAVQVFKQGLHKSSMGP